MANQSPAPVGHKKKDTKKSTLVRCDSWTSRSSQRAVKSVKLRYSKFRTPVIRTRSPLIVARGMTATSGRHCRSCEGEMESHQATTPRNSTTNTTGARRSRDSQSSHVASTAKNVANATRNPADGRLE